jgi:hypothetical protein
MPPAMPPPVPTVIVVLLNAFSLFPIDLLHQMKVLLHQAIQFQSQCALPDHLVRSFAVGLVPSWHIIGVQHASFERYASH